MIGIFELEGPVEQTDARSAASMPSLEFIWRMIVTCLSMAAGYAHEHRPADVHYLHWAAIGLYRELAWRQGNITHLRRPLRIAS